jgi:hypothetical protein
LGAIPKVVRTTTRLEDFLNEDKNMHAREQILMHRLFLDVQSAAASDGYYLNTYFDDVDHDGFDVIFDDQDYIKKIQVKSVHKHGTTGGWDIHKRMLRPSFQWLDMLGFECSAVGEGSEGGIVLIAFSNECGEIRADYYYTDVFVLLLFYCGAIKRKQKKSQEAIENIFTPWRSGIGSERVRIPKAAFLKAKDASSLLALMGLHSTSRYAWKHHAMQLVCNLVGDRSLKFPDHVDAKKMREILLEEIKDLCGDAGIVAGNMSVHDLTPSHS